MLRLSLFLQHRHLPPEIRKNLTVVNFKKVSSSSLWSLETKDESTLSLLEKAGFAPQVQAQSFHSDFKTQFSKEISMDLISHAYYPAFIYHPPCQDHVLVHVPSFKVLSKPQKKFIEMREGKDIFLYRWNGDGSAVLRATLKCLREMHDTLFPFFELTDVQPMIDRAWLLNRVGEIESHRRFQNEEEQKEKNSQTLYHRPRFSIDVDSQRGTAKTAFFDFYRELQEIEIFISMMTSQMQANRQMKITALETTTNNHSIMAMKVNKVYPPGLASRPAIVVIGGQCGYQYSGISSTLLSMYEACFDNTYESVLDQFDIHFIPLVNVDSYVSSFRLDNVHQCRYNSNGVDLSENWGSSTHSKVEMDEDFTFFSRPGPHPFSEAETRAVKQYMEELDKIAGFLDVESYGMRILTPSVSEPSEQAKLNAIGEAMANAMNPSHADAAVDGAANTVEALRVNITTIPAPSDMGGNYITASNSQFFKVGAAIDYLYDKYKIPCFTVQLAPAREIYKMSSNGVSLEYRPPPELIVEIGKQFSKGLVEFAKQLA